MSRNSMETCNGGSLLASFPRDFPRGNEEGSRESREGWRKVHARAFLHRLDEGGNRQRERERDRGEEVEKAVEPCWKLLKSTRARDGSGSGGRNEEGKKGADRISETWNQWLSVTVLSYENLSSDPIVGARGCGIKLIKDSARNPHSMN